MSRPVRGREGCATPLSRVPALSRAGELAHTLKFTCLGIAMRTSRSACQSSSYDPGDPNFLIAPVFVGETSTFRSMYPPPTWSNPWAEG